MKAKKYDIGSKYGMLTLIKEVDRHTSPSGQTKRKFEFVCDCGNTCTHIMNNVNRGLVVSCGCFGASQHITHGGYHTPEYQIWLGMKARCMDEGSDSYHLYGGRGIKVCDSWMSFENFFRDMGSRPVGLSIDRIDVNGNYEPGNCRWATDTIQLFNQRPRINSTGYTGVELRGQSWRVRIKKENKSFVSGVFHSLREAVLERQRLELEWYGTIKTFWKG
jgi:hypothetical protein